MLLGASYTPAFDINYNYATNAKLLLSLAAENLLFTTIFI